MATLAFLATVLAFAAPAAALTEKEAALIEHIKSGSESFYGSLTIAERTVEDECYDENFEYDPENTSPPPKVPCERVCKGMDVNVYGFVSSGDYNPDGDDDVSIISISASKYNYCHKNYKRHRYYYADTQVEVPPATWEQTKRKLVVDVDETTLLAESVGGRGGRRRKNPLKNTKISFSVDVQCRSKDNQYKSTCRSRSVSNDDDVTLITHDLSRYWDCSKEKVGKVTVNGKEYMFDYLNFGTSVYRSKQFQREH